jgi:hypothetical protein
MVYSVIPLFKVDFVRKWQKRGQKGRNSYFEKKFTIIMFTKWFCFILLSTKYVFLFKYYSKSYVQ